MSIVELIQAGNLSAQLAALFWVGMERGASIIVAADPPSSGKTTTLSGLLSFTPPETAVYFTRGQGETFSVPPPSPAYPTYLLINELSDHIPVYTWDDHARRAFELLSQGYRLASTMHADTVQGVLAQLEGDLRIPRAHIANLTFIVPMHIRRQQGIVRRVQEVAFLQADGAGLNIRTIARWQRHADSFDVLTTDNELETFAAWAQLSPSELRKELDRREAFLTSLLKTGVESIPEVNPAIEGYYEQVIRRR